MITDSLAVATRIRAELAELERTVKRAEHLLSKAQTHNEVSDE